MEGYVSCRGILQLGRACMEGCNTYMVGSYVYGGVLHLYGVVLHLYGGLTSVQ